MVSLADAYVRIRPDTSGLDADGISKPAAEMGRKAGEAAGKQFGVSFSSLLKTAAVAAAGLATGQIASFFKSTIEAASDVSEAQNKVQVVFGKSTQAVLDFGKTSATSLGLSKASYLDAVGTLGNLFVALKLPGPEAAKMSTSMVKLAGDLASFNNTSPEQALEALRSGLVGETEPLRQYGVNINAATLQTEAMKLGLISSVKDALTPAQKAQATYALVLDQTKTAQGDFARTSGGLANQQRILTAQFDDLKSTIGAALLPAFTSLVHIVTGQVVPGIKEFIAGLQGKGPIDGFTGGLNTAGLAVRAFFASLKSGDVTSDGLVGGFEKAGVIVRQFGQDIAGFATVLNNNKAAIIAFVGTIATLKLAIEAVIVVQKAWAAIQTAIAFIQLASQVRSFAEAWVLLDAAMAANPIGLVVVAVAALVAGVVLAFNHVGWFHDAVIAAWEGIKTATLFLWHSVIQPAFDGIASAAKAVGDAAQWLWTNAIQPAWASIEGGFNALLSVVKLWWAGIQIEFNLFEAIIKNVIAPVVMWLWHNIFEPAFQTIGVIVKDAWIVVENIFKLWVAFIQITLAPLIKGFQETCKLVFEGISAIVSAWWTHTKAIYDAVVGFIKGPLSDVFTTFWHNTIEPVWNGIRDLISNVWNNGIKPIFTALGNFITGTVAPAFRSGVDLIGQAWNRIQELAKTPVNFVINKVINEGIIDRLNTVTGWLGHSANLSHLQALAGGGLLRGPGTGTSDSILGLAAGGVPTARVSNGEYVVNAKATSKNLGLLEAINSGTPGFAAGGLIGDIVGIITDPIGSIVNLVKKATPIDDIIRSFSGNKLAESLIGMPEKAFEAIAAWVKDHLDWFTGGGASFLGGPGGDSVAAILAVARQFDPTAQVSSGFRPGANDYHGQGLAADIIGSNMDGIANGFYAMSGRLLELIHSPSWFVKNGVRVGPDFYASVFAEHFNHVHVAAYANALGFANGGVINEPIWGVGKSGRQYTFGENGPETIVPGTGVGGSGVNLVINVHGDVGEKQVAAIRSHVDAAFSRLLTQMKTGRRR